MEKWILAFLPLPSDDRLVPPLAFPLTSNNPFTTRPRRLFAESEKASSVADPRVDGGRSPPTPRKRSQSPGALQKNTVTAPRAPTPRDSLQSPALKHGERGSQVTRALATQENTVALKQAERELGLLLTKQGGGRRVLSDEEAPRC